MFGDILTEVYGYARDRRVVWSGFAALLFAAVMSAVIVYLPPAEFWRHKQPASGRDLRQTRRASSARRSWRFWCGSFVKQLRVGEDEAVELGPLAVDPHHRLNAVRGNWSTRGSSMPSAFAGLWPRDELIAVTTTQYVLKSAWGGDHDPR